MSCFQSHNSLPLNSSSFVLFSVTGTCLSSLVSIIAALHTLAPPLPPHTHTHTPSHTASNLPTHTDTTHFPYPPPSPLLFQVLLTSLFPFKGTSTAVTSITGSEYLSAANFHQ